MTALPSSDSTVFDAVVLAGGRGERLGGEGKAHVLVAGRALLDHALDAVAGARGVVVVAPPGVAPDGVRSAFEDPPLGGPVAGIAAGLAALGEGRVDGAADDDADADVPVVVLACDVPGAGPAVPRLLAALAAAPDAHGAALVDGDGRRQTLVAAYRRVPLETALDRLRADGGVHGISVRRLVADLTMVEVADPDDLAQDADTWADVAALDARLTDRALTTTEEERP